MEEEEEKRFLVRLQTKKEEEYGEDDFRKIAKRRRKRLKCVWRKLKYIVNNFVCVLYVNILVRLSKSCSTGLIWARYTQIIGKSCEEEL